MTFQSAKLLENTESFYPLVALQEALFYAQNKSFIKTKSSNVFCLELEYSKNKELLLSKHFSYPKIIQNLSQIIKEHKFLQENYNKLSQIYRERLDFILNFESKLNSKELETIVKRYFRSGGSQRRNDIVLKLKLNPAEIGWFDKRFFGNPFLSDLEAKEGMQIFTKLEKLINDDRKQVSKLNDYIESKKIHILEKITQDLDIDIGETQKLHRCFDPKSYLIKTPNSVDSVIVENIDLSLFYQALAVMILFYNLQIDPEIRAEILNKLEESFEIYNKLNLDNVQKLIIDAKTDNLKTLIELFQKPIEINLKTRVLVREISIELKKDRGLVSWDMLKNR